MHYDDDTCYRALTGRDARFDGVFFTGVTSTGVYCRPVCPARTPLRRHCTFHPSAAAAEAAGFRPCLRCRPETAPGSPAWRGTDATVARALGLIDAGALDTGTVCGLAARLGVGERHLRRLFLRHVGAAPRDVARTRRLHLARRLLRETDLSVSRVSLAAGFGGPRRLHAATVRAWGCPPSALRGPSNGVARADAALTLHLAARPPFHLPELLNYLRPRLLGGVETIAADDFYRRAVRVGDDVGVIVVQPARDGVLIRLPDVLSPHLGRLVPRVRCMLDLDADLLAVASHLAVDADLARMLRGRPAPRLPSAWDPFELAVRAVLGQQVSVAAASTLAARVVARWGESLPEPIAGVTHLFPPPTVLAMADLTTVGVTRARADTVRRLARAVTDGSLDLDDPATAPAALAALPGVGPWTVAYVRLRALGDPDAFPAGDLGLRRALAEPGDTWTEPRLRDRAAAWRPWRGYAARLLWASLGERSGG